MLGTVRRTRRAPLGIALGAIASLGLAPCLAPATAAAKGYYSPGYKGSTSFAAVAPAPLPPVTLGTGKFPDLFVDAAGTAHIVYDTDGGTTTQDAIDYCSLQRGLTSCAQTTGGLYPQEPEGSAAPGNYPGANVDSQGPVPLTVGNQLFVVDRRYPDMFTTPAGASSDTNVFLWSSSDGGATITGPGEIGTNQMGGGAIAYGPPDRPSIGMISRTQTGGTYFQGVPFGQFTSAEAQLGTGDQSYDGGLALDGTTPVAVFADLSGNVYAREWNTTGDIDNAANWSSPPPFHGYQPQIVGGPTGVFVLYTDSDHHAMYLQKIVGGQPSAGPLSLGSSATRPAISESPSGLISLAWTDSSGVWVQTSTDGVHFSSPQFTAGAGSGVQHLVTAATTDGGGFVAFVQSQSSDVGPVILAAFGSQTATGQPGLGPLPGGGVGSAAGDPLASSTCTTATFGIVTATIQAGCFAHDPSNPNLDVSLGEVDINGMRLIPDAGVRIAIDPKLHTIDSSGAVSVVLTGGGLDLTIWHDVIHAQIPLAVPGANLFDLPKPGTVIEGFPVSGDIDAKLVPGGVQIPLSLSLPGYFGGVTGAATLLVTQSGGLNLQSLEFKVADADFGALEVKDLDVSYTQAGEVWKGTASIEVPAGGGVFGADISVEFDNGAFNEGSLDVTLPYPGIPLDLNDTPPQLYLTHGGLGLSLNPPTLTGTIGFGFSPVAAPGAGGNRDFGLSLDASLGFAFGNPVTITAEGTGYLYTIQIAHAKLVYTIPDSVVLTATDGIDLGLVELKGQLSAIIDPAHRDYGAEMRNDLIIHLGALGVAAKLLGGSSDITLPSEAMAINNQGFAVFVPPPGISGFWGTVKYNWGDLAPTPVFFGDATGEYTTGVPQAAPDRSGPQAHAASTGFTIPRGTPFANLTVHGTGGSPAVVLTAPGGRSITPAAKTGGGATAVAFGDAQHATTYVGINHPAAGHWSIAQAPGSQVPVTSVSFALGETAPAIHASLTGRTLRYRAQLPANTTLRFAERGPKLFHVIGAAHAGAGVISFRPSPLPAGPREIVALPANGGTPLPSVVLARFTQPRPVAPGRAQRLSVTAHGGVFAYRFTPPAHAVRTVIAVTTSDGRHLRTVAGPSVRSGSVPVIGFGDAVTVTVLGIGADGRRGPSVSASTHMKA